LCGFDLVDCSKEMEHGNHSRHFIYNNAKALGKNLINYKHSDAYPDSAAVSPLISWQDYGRNRGFGNLADQMMRLVNYKSL